MKLNMTLVEMETEVKFLEVKTLIKKIHNQNSKIYFWLGGVMSQQPKHHFLWFSSGNEFTYSNWFDDNPNFYLNYEFCAEMHMHHNFEWNDVKCWDKQSYICEYSKKELDRQSNLKHLESLRNNLELNLKEKNVQIQKHEEAQKDLKEKLANEIQNNINLKLQNLETEKNLKIERNKTEHMFKELQQLQSFRKDLQKELDKKNEQIKHDQEVHNNLQITLDHQTMQYQELQRKIASNYKATDDHSKAKNKEDLKQKHLTQVNEETKMLNYIFNILQNRIKNSNYENSDVEKSSVSKNNGLHNIYFNTIITNNR